LNPDSARRRARRSAESPIASSLTAKGGHATLHEMSRAVVVTAPNLRVRVRLKIGIGRPESDHQSDSQATGK